MNQLIKHPMFPVILGFIAAGAIDYFWGFCIVTCK